MPRCSLRLIATIAALVNVAVAAQAAVAIRSMFDRSNG
jgi:hypothetical protein